MRCYPPAAAIVATIARIVADIGSSRTKGFIESSF